MAPRRWKVYLAGPIGNCNETQVHEWRREVKARFGAEFDFVDPAQDHYLNASPFEVATRDLNLIRSCDALLVNMWTESIGTAFGVAHAARHGKPVFIVDPNQIRSPMLAFYAQSVSRTLKEAVRHLRDYIRAGDRLREVVKRGGDEEPFQRDKLLESLRRACREAGADDLLAPAQIMPEAVSRLMLLKRTPGKGKLTTRAIRDTVWETLRELEADPLRADLLSGVREAWERFEMRQQPVPPRRLDSVAVHDRPLRVRVFCGKSHTSIWGKNVKEISHLPRDPRRFFEEVCRVDGIQEIRITIMASSRS
ncbi:MAG: ATP cone domain-containing protein, partial [Planctomycetes bacterium]|nr:ATP cone domain-containing protein [Planctomycetota bacterium]